MAQSEGQGSIRGWQTDSSSGATVTVTAKRSLLCNTQWSCSFNAISVLFSGNYHCRAVSLELPPVPSAKQPAAAAWLTVGCYSWHMPKSLLLLRGTFGDSAM